MLLDENRHVETRVSRTWAFGSVVAAASLAVFLSLFTLRAQDPPDSSGPGSRAPKLKFNAVHFLPGARMHEGSASYGKFTLRGPRESSLKPLPGRVTRVAKDPKTGILYGLASHEVYRIDLKKQAATEMDLGMDVPRLSWPCGIAFDSKRRRLLVVSLGGVGYLYAYSPDKDAWSVVCDMNNVALSALEYSKEHDCLYGLAQPHGGPEPVLYQFNAQGAMARKVSLSLPVPAGNLGRGPGSGNAQLVAAGGSLVLIASSPGPDAKGAAPGNRMYLIDPKSGEAQLVGKKPPVVAAPPSPPSRTPTKRDERKDGRELHVVGIYEGSTETGGMIHGPKAPVRVDRPGKLVTLVFTSYERCTWEVSLSDGTKVEKVILGGYERQAAKGLPADVPVVEAWRGKTKTPLLYTYKVESSQFRRMVHQIAAMTDLPMGSFHGTYRPTEQSPLVIDKLQDDPRLSVDYPRPTPLSQLPADVAKLTFRAHHYVANSQLGHDLTASFGDFTLKGPRTDTLRPLPKRVQRIAYDPVGKKHYGIAGHGIVEVDMKKQTTTPMDLGLDVPRLGGPSEITFDTKRGRLLVGTSHGGGYFYVYSPETGEWSVLGKRPGDLKAFAYSERQDCLYGILCEYGGNVHDRYALCKLNLNGAVLQRIPLGGPISPGTLFNSYGDGPTQIIPAGDYLVILATPGGRSPDAGPDGWYTYVVDPKTGKVWLVSKETKAP